MPAAVALLIIVIAAVFAEQQNRVVFSQGERGDVLARASLIRAKLEGDINANIQLVRGLVGVVSTEPDIDQARFSQLGRSLLAETAQIRNIAAAPGMVIQMVHPLEGNRAAIGLDYMANHVQREAAVRARDTGELVLAGPVDLVQGGVGFIGRFPVFVDDEQTGRAFWGLVSAVIDAEQLYRDAGLLDGDLPLEVTLSGRDASGDRGIPFFGPPGILEQDPVVADIVLPSGSWRLSAIPKGGWTATPPNTWTLRALMVSAGLLIFVPMLITGRLFDERLRNVAELRDRESQLQKLSRRLDLALDASKVGVWEYNLDTNVLVWDDRMDELYGVPRDQATRDYTTWRDRLHPDDLARAEEDFRVATEETGRYNSDFRVVLPDGENRHIRATGAVFADSDGTSKIVGVNWDVTSDVALNENLRLAMLQAESRSEDLEAAKQRIEYTALHDSLTGLPNRRYLDERLDAVGRDRKDRRALALLHIDLDRFKQINDTLGHAAGDAMLVHAAGILKSVMRPDDFVARVGGDEFVVLSRLDQGTEEERDLFLSAFASRLIDRMRKPVMYEGHECRFGVSIGIASQNAATDDPKRLMVNADLALYRAKNRGRNRYQFFNEVLQAEIVDTKRTADDILNALDGEHFVPWYQPQFDAHTLEIVGVEALARWRHPSGATLTPDKFLRTAEELNVVSTIDRLILEQALADRRRWAKEGILVPKISVNVSARRLGDEELADSLRALDIEPGQVSFELVESIFLDEQDDSVAWNVDRIKEFGIDIEIDDFGTGYASIVSLLKLKPRRLKIDQQLVMPIVDSKAQRQLVHSIIEIGRSLGIEVVAEGVETMEHARILRELGCHALQGYAFARAMPAADFLAFARAHKPGECDRKARLSA